MKKTSLTLTILLTAGLSTRIFGSVVVLGPSDAANGPLSNGSASIDTTSSEALIGTGAWQANGTAASQYYLYDNASSSTEQGLGQLTINDLNSLSLSTFNTPAQASQDPNWFLEIYTAPYVGGEATWYGNRLTLEPYLANSYSNPGNQWNTFSSVAGNNQLTINDSALAGNLGFYGQPTLANAQSGSIAWSAYTAGGNSTPINYGSLDIEGIVLSTGSGWANGFTGLVDDVNIDTTQGNVQFDLEAVPEPATAGFLLLGFGVLALTRRFRQNGRG
ncbi:MAG: PEP-CTERM sorting domain-containing protein [Limisphaerales bacterium]